MARRRHAWVLNRLAMGVSAGLLAAAVATELCKPAEERAWHGAVAGIVPYDFRFPTPQRIRARLWNREAGLFVPQVFGVGWSVNAGRLFRARVRKSPARQV